MSTSSYTIEAVLRASTSQFTAGMREAQKSIENFKNTTKSLNSVADGMLGVGKALSVGLTAPVIAGVTAVIKSYADLEQAIGGVETLFKNSAQDVITNSEKAYRTAGISGVKYMEQVTSFSATLLQGLKGDTKKAAAYADKAIIQMSDNANKMGTSIDLIQNAYQGFAKDNYTMLDNLKLGYAGTASEMARLVNESGVLNGKFKATAKNVKDIPFDTLIDAIQVTQDKLGITGTTAKEASETVSGSFQSMVAAGKNLIAGLGSPDANIKELMNNLKETIMTFANNIKRVLKNIWDNLPLEGWQKWALAIAVSAGPVLLAVGSVIKTISKLSGTVKAVAAILSNPFGLALVALAALVVGFIHAYKHSETFRNIVNSVIEAVKTSFNELKKIASPALQAISDVLKKLNIGAFAPLLGGIGLVIVAFKKLKVFDFSKLFKFKIPKLPNPFTKITDFAKSAGTAVKGVFTGLGKSISAIFKGIGTGIATAFRGIASSISMLNPIGVMSFALAIAAVTTALITLSAAKDLVLPFLQGIAQILLSLVSGVLQAFVQAIVTLSTVMLTMSQALSMLSPLIESVGRAFALATPFIATIGATITQVVTVISGAIVSIFETLAPYIPDITKMFTDITTVVSNAIVEIVKALAPFIPELTKMVEAVAPVLIKIVDAFTNLVNQVEPILGKINDLLKTFGDVVKDVLDGAKGIIEGFGKAVKDILDGVAGIIDSIGNAFLNAGKGFREFGEAVKLVAEHGIAGAAGIVAVSAAVAGLGIASYTGNLNGFREDLGKLAVVFVTIGQSSAMTAAALSTIAASLATMGSAIVIVATNMPTLITALQSISPATKTAQVAFQELGTGMQQSVTGIVTSLTGLVAAVSLISTFNQALTSLNIAMGMAGVATLAFSNNLNSVSTIMAGVSVAVEQIVRTLSQMQSAFQNVSKSSTSVVTAITSMCSGVSSGMSNMIATISQAMNKAQEVIKKAMQSIVQVVLSAVPLMNNGGMQVGKAMSVGISNGIMSEISFITNTMRHLIMTIQQIAMSGVSIMQTVGVQIGKGLAQGMMSALNDVTKAANALVSQAERAAKAKAQIHSPSRLFRDSVGIFMGKGVAAGIERSGKDVSNAMDEVISNAANATTRLSEMMNGNLNYSSHATLVNDTNTNTDFSQLTDLLNRVLDRDIVVEVNGRELVRATGKNIDEYQERNARMNRLLGGTR